MNQIQHLSWYNFKAGESISEQSWYISVGTQCQRQLDVYDCPTTTTDSATVPLFVDEQACPTTTMDMISLLPWRSERAPVLHVSV